MVFPPLLFELIQDGGNMEHSAAQGDQEPQVFKQVHAFIRTGRPVPVQKLKLLKPEYEPHLDAYVVFVSAWSGGEDGKVIDELDAWVKTKPFRRRIGGLLLQALSDEAFSDKTLYIIGVCKMLYACDAKFTRNGRDVKMLTVSDVQQTLSKQWLKDLVAQAKELQSFGRSVADAQSALSGLSWTKCVGWLDENCMMLVHKKDKGFPYTSIHQIGEAFFKMLAEATGGPPIVGRPMGWPTNVEEPATAPKSKVGAALREIKSDSLSVDVSKTLKTKGYEVGAELQRKSKGDKSKFIYKIKELLAASSTAVLKRIRDADGSSSTDMAEENCSFTELLANWSVVEGTKEDSYSRVHASTHTHSMCSSQAFVTLHAHVDKHKIREQLLRIHWV